MSDKTTIVVAPGTGQIAQQAKYLLKSIKKYDGKSTEVVSFFSEEEYAQLNDHEQEFFEAESTVLFGEIPVSDHPITSKIAALREAEKFRPDGHRVLLDADMLVMNSLDFDSVPEGELYLKPVDIGWNQWGGRDSQEDWEEMYRLFDREFPGFTNRSTVEGEAIPPYWNSGTLITQVELAEEWLNLTKQILDHRPNEFFADQLALAILSLEYEVVELSEIYNYPLHLRFKCPENVRIIHHHGFENLRRVPNKKIRHKINELGLYESEVRTNLFTTVVSSRSVIRSLYKRFI